MVTAREYLAKLKQYHRPSYEHSIRVMFFAREIARKENLEPDDEELLVSAALYHDIGKLKVPIEILNKPKSLTKEEKKTIEKHARYAFDMLKGKCPRVAQIIVAHHEYQKDSYPRKEQRQKDKLVELLALADHYDAARSERSYKEAFTIEEAEKFIIAEFGQEKAVLVKNVE